MGSFFKQTAETMVGKDLDRFPLLKIQFITGWQPIADYLEQQKGRYVRHNGGRPAYSLLSMFKAVLVGQWHSLSDPELEHSLITRIGFYLFCGFDEPDTPGHSTLCRYRNWPVQNNLLAELLNLINRQLTDKGLKIQHAKAAVIDAAIIQTAGGKQRRAIETGETVWFQKTPPPPGKDKAARRVKKDGKFRLGYKQHTRTDHEGYIEKLHISPANEHECHHFEPLLQDIAEGTMVYADKGYDSKANRSLLQQKGLSDGIMRKAHRGHPLSKEDRARNRQLSKTRYVVEQSFGTLHRKFRCHRAAYFGLLKVTAQSHLKAVCINLPKTANRLRVSAAA